MNRMTPREGWATRREAQLRSEFGISRSGGVPVALAVDLLIHDQEACDRFLRRMEQRLSDGWAGAPDGIALKRPITLGKGDIDRNISLATLLIRPESHPEDLGLNPPPAIRISPLSEAIRSGDLAIQGLSGPGSGSIRIEIVTEVDNLKSLTRSLSTLEVDDQMIDPEESLESGVARSLLRLCDGPDPGFSVVLQHITHHAYPEHRRPASVFRRAADQDQRPGL